MRRKPDWASYPAEGTYPLYVLVALSLDICPDDVDLDKDRDDPELAEFWSRLRVASQVVESGDLRACPPPKATTP